MPADTRLDSAEADRELLRRVKSFLDQQGYSTHRTLEISVEQGRVLLQGQLPSFYMRQLAVECVKRVAGVHQIVDLIMVADPDPALPRKVDR